MPVNWNLTTTASSTFTISTGGTYNNNYQVYQDKNGNLQPVYYSNGQYPKLAAPPEPEEQALWDQI